MKLTYGSRSIELLTAYFDQSCVLYASFCREIFMGALLIIYNWYTKKAACYKFSTHAQLEVLWTSVPILFLVITVLHSLSVLYGLELERGIASSYGQVTGNQWYWTYIQPTNGTDNIMDRSYNESRLVQSHNLIEGSSRLILVDQPLFIPQNTNVSLEINAVDVIHSFSLPALGIKVDAVPGRNSHVSLTGLTKGIYIGFCSELCGSGHAFMPINVCVY